MPRVIAAPGLRVPREDNPRTYIEGKAVDVPDTTYYRRRLASGELVIEQAQVAPIDSKSGAPASKGSKA
ncbi:DUF2635 domain-containing protein [Stenotrophomonas sp. B1-1]|uniref:DUF2635 domain-containing protein n=1 Tax=Stenotrophomonas sp. B1-1 TaxID=2710648 RepID=UPI0013DCBD73|nr:DUF2635 domain-containing protein [Stenotrophomonas sp. B1-1]